jgi:Type IV pilin-like G and H, putative
MLSHSNLTIIIAGAIAGLSVSLNPIYLAYGKPSSKVTTASRELAAKTLIEKLNTQQGEAYIKDRAFRSKFSDFPFPINPDISSYEYTIIIRDKRDFDFQVVTHYAIARRPGLKSYIGAVHARLGIDKKGASNQQVKISSVVCQSIRPTTAKSDLQVIFTSLNPPMCATESVRVGGVD